MKLEFSAYTLFQQYLQGRARADAVLAHPAYQVIQAHAAQFGGGLSAGDIDAALAGQPSPFYGLRNLAENLPRIAALAETLRENQAEWLGLARAALGRFLPGEDLSSIVIYPLIGYDMGIGLRETVCMNLNHLPYLRQPEEFLYYLIHECTHVIYERWHTVAALEAVQTPREWQDYFALFLQNEGFAVYAPWDLRRARGGLVDADYRALEDPATMQSLCAEFRAAWDALGASAGWAREQCLDQVFGDRRLTYRVGAHLIRRVEQRFGLEEVRRAFYLGGREFWELYANL